MYNLIYKSFLKKRAILLGHASFMNDLFAIVKVNKIFDETFFHFSELIRNENIMILDEIRMQNKIKNLFFTILH